MTPLTNDQKKMVEQHIPFARMMVGRFLRSHPGDVRLHKDLHQAAMLGLIGAAQRYKPDRACTFMTFATRPVYGAIIECAKDDAGLGVMSRNSCRTGGPAPKIRATSTETQWEEIPSPACDPEPEVDGFYEDMKVKLVARVAKTRRPSYPGHKDKTSARKVDAYFAVKFEGVSRAKYAKKAGISRQMICVDMHRVEKEFVAVAEEIRKESA